MFDLLSSDRNRADATDAERETDRQLAALTERLAQTQHINTSLAAISRTAYVSIYMCTQHCTCMYMYLHCS